MFQLYYLCCHRPKFHNYNLIILQHFVLHLFSFKTPIIEVKNKKICKINSVGLVWLSIQHFVNLKIFLYNFYNLYKKLSSQKYLMTFTRKALIGVVIIIVYTIDTIT
jgi:hypothetical protein